MTSEELERFRRMEELFDAALRYPAGAERDEFFREQEATDSGVLDEVRKLLDNLEQVRAAAPEAPEVLPRFGPWQAIRLLGRGGMGKVYLAERVDGAFQMSVAVKVVPLALASPNIEERFRRERQFLASLDHPKVARLIDGGVTGAGLPYLVMEFVDGLAIDHYCQTHQLDRRSRVALLRQVLEALEYVHGRRVIHRDIKPSNILVDSAGNAKLLDFGTARLVDPGGDHEITKTGVFAFTPEYASPEQVAGKPLEFSSDIYSAGVLLYRLLTGRTPYRFKGHSPAELAETIARTSPEPAALNDQPLEAILSTALRKNPQERYPSAAAMDEDLAHYLNGQPVRARPPRNLLWIAVVAAAMLLCTAGWLLLRRSGAGNLTFKETPSIAVLPFSNLSKDPADQYFVDSLNGDVTESLTRLKTLRVIARSSASVFKKEPRDLRDIASQLRVTHVIEASVQWTGDDVTVLASLVKTSNGAKVWTNTYHRHSSDVASVPTDLAQGVASSMGIAAPVARAKHIPPAEARRIANKALFEEGQLTPEANLQAQADYRQAIEIDPNYAEAYEGLGDAIWNQNIRANTSPDLAERKKAMELFRKSIEVDPNRPSPHSALALYAMQYDWDWDRAERELQEALSAGRNAPAEIYYASLCLIRGRRAEAEKHQQIANDLDPIGSTSIANNALFLGLEGRVAEAREEYEKLVSRNTGLGSKVGLYGAMFQEGQTDAAMKGLLSLPQNLPAVQMSWAIVRARTGARQEALRIEAKLERDYRENHQFMTGFAFLYGWLGDEPNTIKWMERAMDAREAGAMYIGLQPAFAKMQNHPAFRALKRRMNLD